MHRELLVKPPPTGFEKSISARTSEVPPGVMTLADAFENKTSPSLKVGGPRIEPVSTNPFAPARVSTVTGTSPMFWGPAISNSYSTIDRTRPVSPGSVIVALANAVGPVTLPRASPTKAGKGTDWLGGSVKKTSRNPGELGMGWSVKKLVGPVFVDSMSTVKTGAMG